MVVVMVWAAAMATAWGQAPTFGSPLVRQQVEVTDEATGKRRVVTLEKRADGDYNVESLDLGSGRRATGVLRANSGARYSGDIFDESTGTFREVALVELGDGKFGFEQLDYATGRRVHGLLSCGAAGCAYRPR